MNLLMIINIRKFLSLPKAFISYFRYIQMQVSSEGEKNTIKVDHFLLDQIFQRSQL